MSERDQALDLKFFTPQVVAVVNVDIPGEIWRWVKGFHAALYQTPYPPNARGALVTPFPSAPLGSDGKVEFDPIKPQHLTFVETIKVNRAEKNLDMINCNFGKLVYECVWCLFDDNHTWACIFAIDLYGWKELGNQYVQPKRGCAGFYTLPDGGLPHNATMGVLNTKTESNLDNLDPFGT